MRDLQARVDEHINTLINRYRLADDFRIPNAAGDIHLESDLRRRTISLAIKLDPPGDKKRPTAAINWLTRQIRGRELKNVLISCAWPRKTPDTTLNLEQAIEHPEDLVPEGISDLPTGLEVQRVIDLAGRFRGAKTLVEDAEKAFRSFYREIGQHPTPWTPPPPKYMRKAEANEEDVDIVKPAIIDNDKETQ